MSAVASVRVGHGRGFAVMGQFDCLARIVQTPYDTRRLALIRDMVRMYEARTDIERAAEYRAKQPAIAVER